MGSSFIEKVGSMVLTDLLAPLRDEDGIGLPSRYEVIFSPPIGDRGANSGGGSTNPFFKLLFEDSNNGGSRDISMQCNAFQFPGRNLDSTPYDMLQGPAREIVNDITMAEVSGTFYCHNDMREKIMFEQWQNLAYAPANKSIGWYDSYVGSITIYNLDQNNNRKYGVELEECFPKSINAQEITADQATAAQTVTVSFSYRNWINISEGMKKASGPLGTLDRIQGVLANQVEKKLLSKIPKVLKKLF